MKQQRPLTPSQTSKMRQLQSGRESVMATLTLARQLEKRGLVWIVGPYERIEWGKVVARLHIIALTPIGKTWNLNQDAE